MDTLIQLLLVVLLIALAGFFAAAEAAVGTVPRGRLQQLEEEGNVRARRARYLLRDPERFVATAQIGSVGAILLADTFALRALGPPVGEAIGSRLLADVVLTVLAAALVLVIAQYVPRAASVRNAEAVALTTALPVRMLQILLFPAVWLMTSVSRLVHRAYGVSDKISGPFVTEADIKIRVDAGAEEGVIEEDEREMIHSIFEFGDTVAREIMVPRIDLAAVEADTPAREALDLALREGHSRLPVYEDSIDHVVGVLYLRDMVRLLLQGQENVPVREVLRPAYFVPESKKVDELLHELQQRKVHLAVVVDEYGGTAGVVTIEDIVEEIVGEIRDEHEAEEASVQQLGPHEYLVEAALSLADLADLTGLQLEAEEVDTVGGLVYERLGRVPNQGEEVSEYGVRLIVECVEGNRIKKVRILQEEPSPGAADSDEPPPSRPPGNGNQKG